MKTTNEIIGIIIGALTIMGVVIGSIWKVGAIIFKKYQEIQELKAQRMDESNKTIVNAVGELTRSFNMLKDEMIKNNHEVKLELTEMKLVQKEHSEKLSEHSKEIQRLKGG